jgi:hypothetical protein
LKKKKRAGKAGFSIQGIAKKWLTPLQKVARFERKLHGLTVQLSVFFYFFIFFAKGKENSVLDFSRG